MAGSKSGQLRACAAAGCAVVAALAVAGCGSEARTTTQVQPPGPVDSLQPNLPGLLPPMGGASGVGGTGGDFFPGFGGSGSTSPQFPQPLDERPVVRSAVPPRPIQGGTLAISPDDAFAIVADTDRDRVVLVDIVQGGVLGSIALGEGAEPGRVVFDADGRAHIVLRGSGELATLETSTRELVERRAVCGVPQGVAYDAASDSVHVACMGGELVTLPAAGGNATRSVMVEPDLRDVVVQGQRLFVSTFKRAELLELDNAGRVLERTAPPTMHGALFSPLAGMVSEDRTLEPAVAWRTIASPAGTVTMLHQRAQLDEIDIGIGSAHAEQGDAPAGEPVCAGVGGSDQDAPCFGNPVPPPLLPPGLPGQGSGYGGGGGTCSSIVETGITLFGSDRSVSTTPPIIGAVLPVDGAISPDGRWFAIAAAGAFEDEFLLGNGGEATGLGVLVVDSQSQVRSEECVAPGAAHSGSMLGTGQAVSVAFDSKGTLVVQTREPNRLRVYRDPGCGFGCTSSLDISLGGESRRDTGHDLFHANAGAGLACASCHPGGGDDGRTWHFKNLGPRRTQLFTMGIKGTEPLHWDGDLPTLSDLMSEVFVKRMGGAPQSAGRVDAMGAWMETLATLPPMRASDDAAAQRGKLLFLSEEVACGSCHSGSKLTNNLNADVGTGGAFQVPSLINVAYHAPFIHTGCAQTLRDRFDPACGGGDQHGKTSQLSDAQLDDLVAYLETL